MRLRRWTYLLALALPGCGTSSGAEDPSASETQEVSVAAKSATEARSPIDYAVQGLLLPIEQPTDMTCWAASTTIMQIWKQSTMLTIEQVTRALGNPFETMFRQNKGLSAAHKPLLLSRAGMQAEAPQNYTAAGWESLMKRYGPLWVTTDEGFTCQPMIHARIMIGIRGDGSPQRTTVTLFDPATGKEVKETLGDFSRKFEKEAVEIRSRLCGATGPQPEFRVQVVHW